MHALLILPAVSLACANVLPRQWRSQADNDATSLTLLFQNNLNASDDSNHIAVLVTDAVSATIGNQICHGLGSELLSSTSAQNYSGDLQLSLAYHSYAGRAAPNQQYLLSDGFVSVQGQSLNIQTSSQSGLSAPVLCTTNSNASEPQNSTALSNTAVSIQGGSNLYQGYYNSKSFRFLGIRYADQPERFEYTELYEPHDQTINATTYGPPCLQSGRGSEDCFFLNIQTPYIPKTGDNSKLRPVMFWIHGGGFTGGAGDDPLSDGGNLASREDIVVVNVNYRLSTLGFFAIPGTNITGNYGIGDQITALDWTLQNIAYFGGDPNKITIIGESAGAGSVRTLLGSPRAIGKYQGAIAMSNLGGGQTLGLTSNYGTTYSSYYTIEQSYNVSGKLLVNGTNCTADSIQDSIACLKTANATILNTYSSAPRYVVQDGFIVNSTELQLRSPANGTAYVPVMFGIVLNDGASFSNLVAVSAGNLTGSLQAGLDINATAAQSIIDSGLFPFANITGNYTLDAFNVTQRVATDTTFRCIDQATVYAGSRNKVFPSTYAYQFERAIAGYNPNDLPGAPVTDGYPNGNPNLPYFKLHGADMEWPFGNFYLPLRDDNDLYSVQLVSGQFAEFVKSGQPNPSVEYLQVRGYSKTLRAINELGPWQAIQAQDSASNVRHLDYPGYTSNFVDAEQCAWLGYPTDFYL